MTLRLDDPGQRADVIAFLKTLRWPLASPPPLSVREATAYWRACYPPRSAMMNQIDIKDHIRAIPDFPKPGILFYDISTLLAHADAWSVARGGSPSR